MPFKCSTLFRIISRILVLYCLMKEIHLFFFLGNFDFVVTCENFPFIGSKRRKVYKT